jgi:hypothetical protein
VDRYIEGQALVGITGHQRSEYQVGGAGDGQELGETLDHGQDQDLQKFHRLYLVIESV